MKLRFILRDGKRILQQSKQCPVLHTEKWEDVPLVAESIGFDEGTRITTDHLKKISEEVNGVIALRYSNEEKKIIRQGISFERYTNFFGKARASDSDTSEP